MNVVLIDLTWLRCFAFLDDIIVYAKLLPEHDAKIRQVFDRIWESNLKRVPQKWDYLPKEVSYLGHISENGVLPDKTKTQVTEEFPTPQTVKQLKSFLDFMSYSRRFISRSRPLSSPLHKFQQKILDINGLMSRSKHWGVSKANRFLRQFWDIPTTVANLSWRRMPVIREWGRFFLKGR